MSNLRAVGTMSAEHEVTHGFVVGGVQSHAAAFAKAGEAGVWRPASSLIWPTYIEAARWLIERGWLVGTMRLPGIVFAVELPGGFDACALTVAAGCYRTVKPLMVLIHKESGRGAMLDDPAVVEAALQLAKSIGKPYAFGRRAAVYLIGKTAPWTPGDLASTLDKYRHVGLSDADIRELSDLSGDRGTPPGRSTG